MIDKLHSQKQIRQIVPVCSATLWHWIRKGIFPAPIKIGRRVFFRDSDIQAFIKKMAGEDAK